MLLGTVDEDVVQPEEEKPEKSQGGVVARREPKRDAAQEAPPEWKATGVSGADRLLAEFLLVLSSSL